MHAYYMLHLYSKIISYNSILVFSIYDAIHTAGSFDVVKHYSPLGHTEGKLQVHRKLAEEVRRPVHVAHGNI